VWVKPHIPAAPVRDVRLRAAWRTASGPLIAASLFAALFADFDLIVLAGFLSPAELAVIGVCLKLAFLIDFAVYMVQQFATPDIAEGYARADANLIRTASAQANLAATLTTAGAFIGVLVLGKEVLELFRPGFAVGSDALIILAGAQGLRSVFGPALGLLTVVGAERQISISFVLAAGVLVVANVMLVPAFGLMGAAVAVLVTTLFWTATLAVLLYRRTGLRVDAAASLAAFLRGAPGPASRLARSLASEVPLAGSDS
jgi:O-antigen/teichoic acid export membrane protein